MLKDVQALRKAYSPPRASKDLADLAEFGSFWPFLPILAGDLDRFWPILADLADFGLPAPYLQTNLHLHLQFNFSDPKSWHICEKKNTGASTGRATSTTQQSLFVFSYLIFCTAPEPDTPALWKSFSALKYNRVLPLNSFRHRKQIKAVNETRDR